MASPDPVHERDRLRERPQHRQLGEAGHLPLVADPIHVAWPRVAPSTGTTPLVLIPTRGGSRLRSWGRASTAATIIIIIIRLTQTSMDRSQGICSLFDRPTSHRAPFQIAQAAKALAIAASLTVLSTSTALCAGSFH